MAKDFYNFMSDGHENNEQQNDIFFGFINDNDD